MFTRPRLRPAVVVPMLASRASLLALPSSTAAVALDAGTARGIRLELRSLMNAKRAQHGLHRLRPNGALARAARWHAHDMVRRRYVSHYSKAGRGPASRMAGAGYMRGTRRWSVGRTSPGRATAVTWAGSCAPG